MATATLKVDYDSDQKMAQLITELAQSPEAKSLKSLSIGVWEEAYDTDCSAAVQALCELKDSFPALRELFVGEIEGEEAEISWIQQSDLGPLFRAFPQLEKMEIRGGENLRLVGASHPNLKCLRIETGGLPAEATRDVAEARFPNLEHLELWLGCEDYSGTTTVGDLRLILDGGNLPNVKHLGLMNWDKADTLVPALKGAKILPQLKVLDMSMGTLAAAEGLLDMPDLDSLDKLDLSENYLSEDLQGKLRSKFGSKVELREQKEDEDPDDPWRYTSVSE